MGIGTCGSAARADGGHGASRAVVALLALLAAVALSACEPWEQSGGDGANTARAANETALDLDALAGGELEAQWRAELPEHGSFPDPVVTEDHVHVLAGHPLDPDRVGLYTFDRAGIEGCDDAAVRTCEPLWVGDLPDAPWTGVAVWGDTVVVAGYGAYAGEVDPGASPPGLRVFDAAGGPCTTAGEVTLCEPVATNDRPVAAGPTVDDAGRLFVLEFDEFDDDLAAVPTRLAGYHDPDGSCDAAGARCTPTLVSDAAPGSAMVDPAAFDGEVWFPTTDGLAAVDAAGVEGCSAATPAVCEPSRSVTLEQSAVVPISVIDGVLYTVTATGEWFSLSDAELVAVDLAACPHGAADCAPSWTRPGVRPAMGQGVVHAGEGVIANIGYGEAVTLDPAACAATDGADCVLASLSHGTHIVGGAAATSDALLLQGGCFEGMVAFDPTGERGCAPDPDDPDGPPRCDPVAREVDGTVIQGSPVPAFGALHLLTFDLDADTDELVVLR